MNNKKILKVIILTLILFSALAIVSANSFTINHDSIDLTIKDNGILHVTETLDYKFDGEFNGVYRDLTIREGQTIKNINVTADGAYPVLKQEDQDGNKHITIYLYADAAHTQKIKDTTVKVSLDYDFTNVVTLYNDTALLQYNLWGEKWEQDVGGIDLTIHTPGTGNTIYFTPENLIKSNNTDGNTITATTDSISKDEVCGFVLLMPLDDFDNATYAKKINENGKEEVLKSVNDGKGWENLLGTIFLVLSGIPILIPISGLVVYLLYGREPEVSYDGIYERDLPTNDSPAVVNALVSSSSVGMPDMKGFEATILNLIDKKVLNLEKQENVESDDTDLILIFNGITNELSDSETKAYRILEGFSDDDGKLNLSELDDKLSDSFNASLFSQQIDYWKSIVYWEMGENGAEDYFIDKGPELMSAIGFFGIFFGVVLIALSFFLGIKNILYPIIGGIFSIVVSLIMIFVPESVFGHYTEKGKLFQLKWRNFKKFLTDNSLIKEHPPESIVIWKKYLIYGTALGVADNVYKSMKINAPEVFDYSDDLFLYHRYDGSAYMANAYSIGNQTSSSPSSDFGGFDDFGGGGFDGGGGGAF